MNDATWTPIGTVLRPLLLIALVACCGQARAEGDKTGREPLLPAYVQECGSCHVAFAPGLLPASSWHHLMGGLKTHFGSDASLDPPVMQTLSDWLAGHAASGKRAQAPAGDRITQSAWFLREHGEARAAFGTARVKRASDCAACHTLAADGSYRERDIRVPR